MLLNRITSTILLAGDRERVWHIFSNPLNLKILTPDWLHLEIVEPEQLPSEIYAGLIITYQVQAIPFVKNTWVTEITHMIHGHYFIDEQRYGPYAFWHHQHHFQKHSDGVIMKDLVHYRLPCRSIGQLVLGRLVKKKLNAIFDYRFEKIQQLFPGSRVLADAD
ncbi:MAG: SRPBCC family protein [Parachlamydia sp.]|nr:SRPBCC family protein [Parachlamydia sp.]